MIVTNTGANLEAGRTLGGEFFPLPDFPSLLNSSGSEFEGKDFPTDQTSLPIIRDLINKAVLESVQAAGQTDQENIFCLSKEINERRIGPDKVARLVLTAQKIPVLDSTAEGKARYLELLRLSSGKQRYERESILWLINEQKASFGFSPDEMLILRTCLEAAGHFDDIYYNWRSSVHYGLGGTGNENDPYSEVSQLFSDLTRQLKDESLQEYFRLFADAMLDPCEASWLEVDRAWLDINPGLHKLLPVHGMEDLYKSGERTPALRLVIMEPSHPDLNQAMAKSRAALVDYLKSTDADESSLSRIKATPVLSVYPVVLAGAELDFSMAGQAAPPQEQERQPDALRILWDYRSWLMGLPWRQKLWAKAFGSQVLLDESAEKHFLAYYLSLHELGHLYGEKHPMLEEIKANLLALAAMSHMVANGQLGREEAQLAVLGLLANNLRTLQRVDMLNLKTADAYNMREGYSVLVNFMIAEEIGLIEMEEKRFIYQPEKTFPFLDECEKKWKHLKDVLEGREKIDTFLMKNAPYMPGNLARQLKLLLDS